MVTEPTTQAIQFILNAETVYTRVSPGLLALDFVRQNKGLSGTKSGCREGDCGACCVIVGSLDSEGEIRYRPMTSCLLPMGELHGKHLVTIEGLNTQDLTPVQKAMVDCGGTQCGFCTPGFIVAMTAGLMEPKLPLDESGVRYAISGNLCRCTGYRSIVEAGCKAAGTLQEQLNPANHRIADLVQTDALPAYFTDIPERLRQLDHAPSEPLSHSTASPLPVAGGTDLYVQRGDDLPHTAVNLLNTGTDNPLLPPFIHDGRIHVDARTTFEDFAESPLVREQIPAITEFNDLIASWPIRTRSSLGGNICNASPIADMTCLLLALETELTLANPAGAQRRIPLKSFYLGYKELAKTPEEIITSLSFPALDPGDFVNWEKVSKRAWLDIASVNAAAKITVNDRGQIVAAHLALGGVAPTPLYLNKASAFLAGKALEAETVHKAVELALAEFNPISDIRGSAAYKRLLARQFIRIHFSKLFPETLPEAALHATY